MRSNRRRAGDGTDVIESFQVIWLPFTARLAEDLLMRDRDRRREDAMRATLNRIKDLAETAQHQQTDQARQRHRTHDEPASPDPETPGTQRPRIPNLLVTPDSPARPPWHRRAFNPTPTACGHPCA